VPDSPETRIRLLEEQAAEARAERRALDRQLATFGPLATQILEAVNDLRHLTQDFEDLKRENNEDHRQVEQKVETLARTVGGLCTEVKTLREDYDEDQEGRQQERKDLRDARRNFGVAMIGALALVMTALIGAIATIVAAGM
jgi:chromosome segregation ATPase